MHGAHKWVVALSDLYKEWRMRPMGKRIVMNGAVLLFALAAAGRAKADGDLITVISNIHNITSESFSSTSGDVLDGCITPGTHRVMRFDFASRNVGDASVTAGVA